MVRCGLKIIYWVDANLPSAEIVIGLAQQLTFDWVIWQFDSFSWRFGIFLFF